MNTQKPEQPQTLITPESIEIVDLWSTIQGEGPYMGARAIFIRTAGCNLKCSFCDTQYTDNRRFVDCSALAAEVVLRANKEHVGLVVITGGEPFRQKYIGTLVNRLLELDDQLIVQIETNGTLFQPGAWNVPRIHITCSPKAPSVNKELLPFIRSWKFVIDSTCVDEFDGLPRTHLRSMRPYRPLNVHPSRIFVHALDEGDSAKNDLHTAAAIQSSIVHGYRMGVQMHKLLGLA